MGLFSGIFGKRKKNSAEEDEKNPPNAKSFLEKDNLGTRHDTDEVALGYWTYRQGLINKDPYVLYTFDNEKDAREALLELPCIHIAKDSQKLICTETLIFGYYYSKSGKYQAIICGEDLTNELWKQAKTSFAKHGGTRKNDLEPKQRTKPVQKATSMQPEKVKFVREENVIKNGVPTTYRIYKAPNTESAKTFLQKNPVTKNFYYIIVETPDGNYGRDIQGIYKEQT